MCASHAYISFDAVSTSSRLPIHNAILELTEMATDFAEREGTFIHDESAAAVIVDAKLDGARYLLMRMPSPRTYQPDATQAPFMHNRQPIHESLRERRHAFGNFRRALVVDGAGVDGNINELQRLQKLLREWGFDVRTAAGKTEALKMLEEPALDLFIVGSNLPLADGIELCRQISAADGDSMPYILIIERQTDLQTSVAALNAGATDYLTLPLQEDELKARLTVATRILDRQDRLIRSRNEYRDQASRDALTNLWNRRAILSIFEEELNRAQRNNRSTGIMMVDLDHFKDVNDAYGHLAGDMVLKETGRRLRAMLRNYDSIGRYGGEEFLIVVPGAHEAELKELAERLRHAIEEQPIQLGNEVRITISIGAAIAEPGGKPAAVVFSVADTALYKAKNTGRNRVVLES